METQTVTERDDEYDMVARVCAAFGFGEPVAVARVRTGYLNRDEDVTLADGRRLFLKGSRHRDVRYVAAEHAIIAHAAARGVPTPLPLPVPGATPDGGTVAVVDGVPWSAFPFVDGSALTGVNVPERLGAWLAETHQALAGCPTAGLTFAEGPLAWDTGATLAEIDHLEARAMARERVGAGDPFDRWTRQAFAALRRTLRDAPPPERFAGLPAQVIHGDFYPPNLLTDAAGRLRAVLDWEFAAVRPRVWDVLRAVAFTFLGVHGETANAAAARRCIAAYRAVAPLPADELAAGVQLYLWRTAHNLNKYRWHDERGPGLTDALAPGDLALMEWLHGQGATALVE